MVGSLEEDMSFWSWFFFFVSNDIISLWSYSRKEMQILPSLCCCIISGNRCSVSWCVTRRAEIRTIASELLTNSFLTRQHMLTTITGKQFGNMEWHISSKSLYTTYWIFIILHYLYVATQLNVWAILCCLLKQQGVEEKNLCVFPWDVMSCDIWHRLWLKGYHCTGWKWCISCPAANQERDLQ